MSNVPFGIPFVVPSTVADELGTAAVQAQLADEWPVLSVVLGGRQAREGAAATPQCSIILKIDNGRLGFCICPDVGPQVAFGVVPDPSRLIESLEGELQQGNYAWRPRKPKRG